MVRPWGREGISPHQDRIGARRERYREGIEVSDCGNGGVGTGDFGGGDAIEGTGVVPEHHRSGSKDGERDEDLQQGKALALIAGHAMLIAGGGLLIAGHCRAALRKTTLSPSKNAGRSA